MCFSVCLKSENVLLNIDNDVEASPSSEELSRCGSLASKAQALIYSWLRSSLCRQYAREIHRST